MTMFVAVYSAVYDDGGDGCEARSLRDTLKDGGVRVKYGRSVYVGHKMIEVHVDDLTKASAVLVKAGMKYVAECCRTVRKERRQSVWARR